MARKVGQIIAPGDRRWLIRVYLGRDRETKKRNYHNRTIYGSIREAQAYLTRKLRERDLGRDLEGAKITLNEYLGRWIQTAEQRRALMPFLPVFPEEQASAEVKKIYEYVTRRWGFLPNYFQALAHDPKLLQDQVNLYTNAMFDERGLPKIIKEQIATVVSGINMSSYCLSAHLEILGRIGMDRSLARRLSIDYKSTTLDPKVVELLKFCDKLTNHPADMQRADIENLRQVGWNDAAIF